MDSKPATSTTPTFPVLPVLANFTPQTFLRPAKRINENTDLPRFLASAAYRDISIWVQQLNRALCPRKDESSWRRKFSAEKVRRDVDALKSGRGDQNLEYPPSIVHLCLLLDRLYDLVEEAPPYKGPRRFGNVNFRRWFGLLEERADGFLREHVPGSVLDFGGAGILADGDRKEDGEPEEQKAGPLDELKGYLLGSFGSAQRLDYGTGHELSFLAFLACLWKLNMFACGPADASPGEMERLIVLGVFDFYLRTIRHLILTYNLEPAGSHGVWGLDDHSFLPYIFGSAQLARPISDSDPMPIEGSHPDAPAPSDITKAHAVAQHRSTNLYFAAVGFINDVKKGPFWEHSPVLFDVSGIRDGWGKINKGMVKMFEAEVLAKFPVVQHFLFGSLFSWDLDGEAPGRATVGPAHVTRGPKTEGAGTRHTPCSKALGGVPYTRPGTPTQASGGAADVPNLFPRRKSGTSSHQFAVPKAPWAN